MSLLTDRKAFEQWYACNAFNYEHNPIGSRECGLQWAAWQAAQAAVIAKLATVSVEPIGWIRITKNSRPEDVTVIDIRKEEADEWKSQFIPGFARSEPMYSAEALAAARVQALEEFKADLADALCADCENGVKSLNVKALEKFRNDYPTLSALIVGKDV